MSAPPKVITGPWVRPSFVRDQRLVERRAAFEVRGPDAGEQARVLVAAVILLAVGFAVGGWLCSCATGMAETTSALVGR